MSQIAPVKNLAGALRIFTRIPAQVARAVEALYRNQDLCRDVSKKGREHGLLWTTKEYVRGLFDSIDECEPLRRWWQQESFPVANKALVAMLERAT